MKKFKIGETISSDIFVNSLYIMFNYYKGYLEF